MADRLKTDEEYQAAALLLGMNYDAMVHTFWIEKTRTNADGDIDDSHFYELDADTMEQLSYEELERRYKVHHESEKAAGRTMT